MNDYAVAFGVPKSHGCIFNVPQVGGFFRVVLRIWGRLQIANTEKKSLKIQGVEQEDRYGRTTVYYDPKRL